MLRKAKIVCTIGKIPPHELRDRMEKFINAGMDVARINMAHYNLQKPGDRKYLEDLIHSIRDVADNLKKTVAIMGDIQGPKVRIRGFLGKYRGEKNITVSKDERFILTSGVELPEGESGATITYEGDFNFFEDIRRKENVKKDDKGVLSPIEFWFADGKVILEALVGDITPTSASCRVIVSGELKRGQGVSVKNSTIDPGAYKLANYSKDRRDIDFLLQKEVDLLALSFVNSSDDVKNLQQYIALRVKVLKLKSIADRLRRTTGFPIIAKIETEKGFRCIDEIMEVSYGIMVARGDLALKTGIQTIGIFQKQIIDKCVTAGKPVITATQMLLSMMDFKEPRRPEATDVTNAIFDGTDALMLSEETADPISKFPVEAIAMMAQIAEVTEKELKRRNELEYKYKIDQRHEKILANLKLAEGELEDRRKHVKVTDIDYQKIRATLQKREVTNHISYNACEKALALRCDAIIVLTETGGTARMISRFKPDTPILAGVYDNQIARILKLSYGVEAFKIDRNDFNYPLEECKQVIAQALKNNLVKEEDRVILVAGYPRGELGTVTSINVYNIQQE